MLQGKCVLLIHLMQGAPGSVIGGNSSFFPTHHSFFCCKSPKTILTVSPFSLARRSEVLLKGKKPLVGTGREE